MRLILMLAFMAAMAVPQGELLTPCGYTAPQLESALLWDLKPLADEFIEAEQETGVNAVFLASVAALESGWGRSYRATEHNNLFGWGNHKFASQAECIEVVAGGLVDNYLRPTGKYYNGCTVEGVSVKYNNTDHWRTQVRQIMRDIDRRANGTEEIQKGLQAVWD